MLRDPLQAASTICITMKFAKLFCACAARGGVRADRVSVGAR